MSDKAEKQGNQCCSGGLSQQAGHSQHPTGPSRTPSPEGVKFALEHLGSSPEETLYIGDSTVDAETAQNAGVDFAGVLNGMTTAEELRVYPHKIIMQNLGELVQ